MFLKNVALWPALTLIFLLPLSAQNGSSPDRPVLDLSSMDKTVDPCVDFYTYSCGGWMKSNPIPPDQSSWGAYGKLQDENLAQLRTILEHAETVFGKIDAVTQKIGDYYASCMDEAALEKLGAAPLTPELKRISGLKSKDAIAEYLATSQFPTSIYGSGSLFSFRSSQDYRNSSEEIAEADQGGLGLPDRDYYLKDDPKSQELRKAYLAHVQKMFELLGDEPKTAAAEAATVMRIETELAHGHLTRVERRDPQKLNHPTSIKELEKLSPTFSWNVYLSKHGLGSIESLNVATPEYFRIMSATIEKENLPDWKVYLRWHATHSAATDLSSAFDREDFNFYGKTLRGRQQLPPRWKRCTNDVDNDLGEALGQAYVAKYFGPDAKVAAVKMVKEIEAAMQSEIRALPWMGAGTRQQALTKLEAIRNKVGYPDRWRDYSTLKIVRGDEMGNTERASWFEFRRQLAKIGKPVDRGEWTMTPPTVNAYYDAQKNDINFPAGILQPPLFGAKSDAAPNYGNTGGTMGHELTHAFDDEGSQFDAQGNLRNWWTEQDKKEFEQRTKCVSDEYSNFTAIDDLKVNGPLTLGENVADNGGMRVAYMALLSTLAGKQPAAIDGLTPQQRFFLGWANGWCQNRTDALSRMLVTVDPHSPGRWRVNGVVSNMPEF